MSTDWLAFQTYASINKIKETDVVLQDQITLLEADVVELQNAEGGIPQLTEQVATNTADISTLQIQVGADQENISALQELTTAQGESITNLTNEVSVNGENIATNTANISTNTKNIATNTSNISTIQTSLGTSTDLGTTTAWGQARLSRPITNYSTTLQSTSALPSSRATAIMYGEVLLNLLDTGNTQERTIGNANITIKNGSNTNANLYLQLVVNGSITEILTSIPAGVNHSTTFPISGFSSSIAVSGSIPIRLNAWTLSGQTLTPTYIQIWGIGQMN